MTANPDPHLLPAIESATLTLYRFHELGYAIDLDRARECLSDTVTQPRTRAPVRRSESIEIAQPPLWVEMGAAAVELEGMRFDGSIRAGVYDLGAVSLALTLPVPRASGWETVADLFAVAQDLPQAVERRFLNALDDLERLIGPAIQRPERSALVEDYCVLLIERLAGGGAPASLSDHSVVRSALLGERRPLSPEMYATVAGTSYYPEDLALLSWNGALVVEPDPLAAGTALDLLEFANVELLLLRSYDGDLEAQLLQLNQRISSVRGRPYVPLVGRYNTLLNEVQQMVIEITEVTERIDNAFRVTEDVYWNRLYTAALGVLRVSLWRSDVEHRLNLLRESYSMLHSRADSDRSASLEWIIILLIAFEIVLAFAGWF